MEPNTQALISLLLVLCLAQGAFVQDRQPDQTAPNAATTLPADASSLTGKERMGKKWMDEQRINNCNVPADKRGTKSRPGNCPQSPSE